MSDYQYYFMDRNGLWSERCQEVVEKGLKNASPIARLIYSCETGQGIDQHASEDLKAVSAALQAAADALAAREAMLDVAVDYLGKMIEQHPQSWTAHDATDWLAALERK
jgi:hypothetical protein